MSYSTEERAKAIAAANFVKQAISKSLMNTDVDADATEVADHIESQLKLFVALGFIKGYERTSDDKGDYNFRMISCVDEASV